MRIIIKEPDSKKGFRLILPYHMMVNLCVRKSWVKMGLKHRKSPRSGKGASENDIRGNNTSGNDTQKNDTFINNEKMMAFVDALDFGELRGALHDLSMKSGIVLVEVAASDGTFVQIVT